MTKMFLLVYETDRQLNITEQLKFTLLRNKEAENVFQRLITLVFGLDLKCLVLWQLLLLACATPTHAQKYLGKNTFIYLFVSPIDAGSQKCERQKKILFEMGKLIFEIRAQVLCKHLWCYVLYLSNKSLLVVNSFSLD